MAVDYSRAYTARWRLFRVNEGTWADGQLMQGMLSASVTRDAGGDAPEIDSGRITIACDPSEAFEEGYYRIVMTAEQDGAAERVDVATLLCGESGGQVDRKLDRRDIVGRSVLHPAATTSVLFGEYVGKGEDGAARAGKMLQEAIHAPVYVEGSFELADNYDFDIDSTVLASVWALLDAGGFCLQTDGRGRVHVRPMPTEAAISLDAANARLLEPSTSHQLDLSEIPNRFTARLGGEVSIATNEEPSSQVSFPRRGYWVDASDNSPAMLLGESLDSYAARKLVEASVAREGRTYTRRWAGEVGPFDIVDGSQSTISCDGSLRIGSQDYDCSNGIMVTEHAAREISVFGSPQTVPRGYSGSASGYGELADLFGTQAEDVQTAYAEVTRIDSEGTVWVHFQGGVDETPIHSRLASVKVGDAVPVRIAHGRAEIPANKSDLPAPSSETASISASVLRALSSAATANDAAQSAVSSASTAAQAAAQAVEIAEGIEEIAEQAQEDAQDAKEAAESAEASAVQALDSAQRANFGLSEVERVVGTLNWIEEHGEYISQEGQQFDPEAFYYEAVYTYDRTTDTEIVQGKTYYTRTGSGTDEDPYVYTPVQNPVAEDLPNYYEVTSTAYKGVENPVPEDIDSYYILELEESVQNYLASHLSQTDYGLNLMFDGTTEYIHIGTVDGFHPEGLYLFVAGGIRSSYSDNGVSIGPDSSFHVVVTNTALNFYQGAALVAYVNNNELNIPAAVVEKSIKLGDWMLQVRPNGNMGIFYVG